MSKNSFAARIKRDGNINAIKALAPSCSADEIKEVFARGRIKLITAGGDIPLLRNLPELERTALPKKTYLGFLAERETSLAPTGAR
ncbi:MAG TPA: hypothetical protein VG320_10660 [Paraburkholderia sp.]|jgi:hypothetical protein|uniref:hypothetical protein n=1 Tax=Paraburkholderia sp. TaxID=1926495 RepID=UPI002DF18CBF|nr:hypothetical protein [Paraburkholderia sp.]